VRFGFLDSNRFRGEFPATAWSLVVNNGKDSALSPPPGTGSQEPVLVIAGRLSGDAAAVLCERLVRLLDDGRARSVVCDLSAVDRADLAAVDGLARLQLAAHRRGRRMRLRGSSREMRQLIALLGLGDILPAEVSERRRTLGQAEQRKQGGRIEEGGETDHPAV
jgi:anti-anti-sigma regulatory factor